MTRKYVTLFSALATDGGGVPVVPMVPAAPPVVNTPPVVTPTVKVTPPTVATVKVTPTVTPPVVVKTEPLTAKIKGVVKAKGAKKTKKVKAISRNGGSHRTGPSKAERIVSALRRKDGETAAQIAKRAEVDHNHVYIFENLVKDKVLKRIGKRGRGCTYTYGANFPSGGKGKSKPATRKTKPTVKTEAVTAAAVEKKDKVPL